MLNNTYRHIFNRVEVGVCCLVCCCFFYLKAIPMVSCRVLFCFESCIHIATFVREGGRKWQLNEQTGCRAVLPKPTGSSYCINKWDRPTIITYREQQGCNSNLWHWHGLDNGNTSLSLWFFNTLVSKWKNVPIISLYRRWGFPFKWDLLCSDRKADKHLQQTLLSYFLYICFIHSKIIANSYAV